MIGSVIKRGNTIYVYDERGKLLCTKSGGDVMGYTGTSFSVKRNHTFHRSDIRC